MNLNNTKVKGVAICNKVDYSEVDRKQLTRPMYVLFAKLANIMLWNTLRGFIFIHVAYS